MKWPLAVGCGLLLSWSAFAAADEPATEPTTTKSTTEPASRPASRPAASGRRSAESKAAEEALKTAILALTKEAQDTFRKKDTVLPRATSDYFKDKSPGIDQDSLLAVLNRSVSRDPRVDAYVKLQLLSAVERFDVEHAKPAIMALVGAPSLMPLPGLGQREQQEWDRKSQNVKKDDIYKINDAFKAERAAGEAANAPMIAYRNALRDKISVDEAMKPKLFQARVEELSQRAAAGFDTFAQWKDLAISIQTWSATAPKREIAAMGVFLKDYARRTGPTVYKELRWSSPKARTQKAYWSDDPAVLNETRMKALIDALKVAETNAI